MDRLARVLAETALDDLLHDRTGLNEGPSRVEPASETRVMGKQRRSERSRT
jgi:hypothetical protein